MTSRRNFIKQAALGGAGIFSLPKIALPSPIMNNPPIVISTWNFGIYTNEAAWKILSTNGRALDAIEQGIHVAENDLQSTSVGLAGYPDREGHTTLDACIMDENYNCGSVIFLEKIKHPISVARKIMETTPHVILAGSGAQQWALQNGFELDDYKNPEAVKAYREWLKTSQYKPVINFENHDTIGMVAMDANQNLSGGCSTSGMAFKIRGRVGDSPIIGAGLYVDNEVGACTSTGVGEEVIRIVGSHLVVEKMRDGMTPQAACKYAVERMIKIRKEASKEIQVGFIAISKNGEYGGYAIQPGFNYAVYTEANGNILIDAQSYY
ncbi:MAG: N(4)-(beta-N-acetylglucosaminyl)-L-asparaginase [Chitinophagales bacterium]|nr:N(4)-(beta-N-acetylglucosaminyl)-L-asparaginase [Chitinophagales bacterium]MBP9549347.1 N(4)-(beta-N-acetylglucosaminyl)-L-asparaginase [Chitinophagales bacterium]